MRKLLPLLILLAGCRGYDRPNIIEAMEGKYDGFDEFVQDVQADNEEDQAFLAEGKEFEAEYEMHHEPDILRYE